MFFFLERNPIFTTQAPEGSVDTRSRPKGRRDEGHV
jgi:hypothetical protein